MKRIERKNAVYTMSPKNEPVLKVKSGETVVFETYDCFKNQVLCDDQSNDSIDYDLTNPATGPLFVEEAEAGDILKVSILDIAVNKTGVMGMEPKYGVLGDLINEPKFKVFKIENDKIQFNDRIEFSINPMIGVIGVAPKDGDIATMVPDVHGGNMDCKRIIKGSTLYLPVFNKGALLAIGDLHGLMADGEISISGLEIDGQVTVKVEVIKDKKMPTPLLIEGEHIITIASAETLDEAADQATLNMHQLLTNELKMDVYEAGMLLSLVGDLRICQVVDPLKTARMELPISILEKYNYQF